MRPLARLVPLALAATAQPAVRRHRPTPRAAPHRRTSRLAAAPVGGAATGFGGGAGATDAGLLIGLGTAVALVGGGAAAPARPRPTPRFGPTLRPSAPTALRIPAIGLDVRRVVDLGRDSDGGLQVPDRLDVVGWYVPGPAPGQLGPAVLAGHVDSKKGPAVFWRLGDLRPGDAASVSRADGTSLRFLVDKVVRYPKADFPTVRVYGNSTNRAELRLITCGGSFDHATGHYRDNVVVFAHLLGLRSTTPARAG